MPLGRTVLAAIFWLCAWMTSAGAVKPQTTVSSMASARCRRSIWSSCRMGLGVSAMTRWGCLFKLACRRPKMVKVSVAIMTVGMPRFSSSTVTWLHHVVQEPQSPVEVTTTSTRPASSSSNPPRPSISPPVREGTSLAGCSWVRPLRLYRS